MKIIWKMFPTYSENIRKIFGKYRENFWIIILPLSSLSLTKWTVHPVFLSFFSIADAILIVKSIYFFITIMPKTKQLTSQNNNPSQSDEQKLEQKYQEWLEREMLRQYYGAFYDY